MSTIFKNFLNFLIYPTIRENNGVLVHTNK